MKKFLPIIFMVVIVIFLMVTTLTRRSADRSSQVTQIENKVGAVKFELEVFASDLKVPWGMVFTSENRMLVSEREGRIRVILDGKLAEKPLFTFDNVFGQVEAGLMGIEIDPDYSENKFVYASLSYIKGSSSRVKVVRLVDKGETVEVDRVLIDDILAAKYHDGSRIKFGPDKKLYITTGDATKKELAQKLDSLNGKILRINPDGSIPFDNPIKDSPVYSYGHRNPQGIAWSVSGLLWQTEHGPSGTDGPGGGDEINVIKAGHNYGWPLVSHEKRLEGTEFPKLIFTPAVAPAGAMFYRGDVFPQFKNNFFFTGLRGEGVFRVVISDDKPEEILAHEKVAGIEVGRIRDIVEGPDGLIYFATSNRDGRGKARDGDDKIYRIIPR